MQLDSGNCINFYVFFITIRPSQIKKKLHSRERIDGQNHPILSCRAFSFNLK